MKNAIILGFFLLLPGLLFADSMEVVTDEYNYKNHSQAYEVIEKLDLSFKKIINNNFHSSIFKDCSMIQSTVSEIELSRSLIEGGNYQDSTFSLAYMEEAKIRLANFDGAKIVGSKSAPIKMGAISIEHSPFRKTMLHRAQMVGASLHRVDFSHSTLSYVDLKNALLDKVDFSHCKISNLNLKGAKLKDVYFSRTRLSNINIQDAEIWDSKTAKYRRLTVKDLQNSGALSVGAKAIFTGMLSH